MNSRETRDMFAAHAIEGLIAVGEFNFNKADEIAHDAYKLAECMMTERKRRYNLKEDGTVTWVEKIPHTQGE